MLNLSISHGVFPEKMKISRVIPKSGDEYLLLNYRPISVLPYFSKLLEHIMCNRTYDFLIENKTLYEKQFGFHSSNSTEPAILQLSNQISNSFNEKQFTLGVFINFSKASDTVYHNILTKKWKNME